jgi:hypothetical protein
MRDEMMKEQTRAQVGRGILAPPIPQQFAPLLAIVRHLQGRGRLDTTEDKEQRDERESF